MFLHTCALLVLLPVVVACSSRGDGTSVRTMPSGGMSDTSSDLDGSVVPSATDRAPATDAGVSAPLMSADGSARQLNAGGSTPLVNAGGSASQMTAGGSTPLVSAGGSTSQVSAGGSTPLNPVTAAAGSGGAAGNVADSNEPVVQPEPASADEVLVACEQACASFEEACGIPCPETCEDSVARIDASCTTQSRDMFSCFSELDPTESGVFNCDARDNFSFPLNIRACYPEIVDTYVCDDYGGAFCREGGDSEETFCAEDPRAFGPVGYSCVAAAAPEECSRVVNSASTFCCPEGFEFPADVLLE